MKSLEKTLKLIETLKKENNGLGISELGERLNMPVATVHRILSVLLNHGYIIQNHETKKYKLGLQFLEISKYVLESIDLRKQANPFLVQLMMETDETVHLSVLEKNEVVFIDRVESQQLIRSIPKIGMRVSPHLSASGKVMLAYMPEDKLNEILSKIKFEKWLPNSIKDLDTLLKEVETIKIQGFAVDDEECELDGRCLAAPVLDHSGKVIAAISISGPTSRLSIGRLRNELSGLVVNKAREISYSLGYRI